MRGRRPFRSVDLADRPIPTSASLAEAESLRMFLQACFGALIGVIAAMAIAHAAFPPDGPATSVPPGILSEHLASFRVEPREKSFYLLSLVLGTLGGTLATAGVLRSRVACALLGALLAASIPLNTAFARRTLQGHLPAWVGLAVAVILATGLAIALRRSAPRAHVHCAVPVASDKASRRWIYALLLVAITLIIVPSSLVTVAVHLGLQFSYVSFIVGPSLYFLGHGLLPGIDYYAQYGVGLGWVFSLFPGTNTQEVLLHYVALAVTVTWLFYAHLILILQWLYRSWLAAATVSILSLILLFHTAVHFEDPSSTVLRYPLLTVCAALLARWVAEPGNWFRLLALALAIATCLFLETETGIITAIAVTLGFVAVSPWRQAMFLWLTALGFATLCLFLLLLFIIFGRGALTLQFLEGWIEPLTIYGVAGLGAWPILWTLKYWNWLYNFVAPGMALATVAVAIRAGRDDRLDRPRTAVLVYFAVSALLMMAKFINMSLVAVWQMNALGMLVAVGWWAVVVARALPPITRFRAVPIPIRSIVASAMLTLPVALAATTSDRRNPTDYALKSWLKYPALALAPFHSTTGCTTLECVANLPDPRDVALVRDRTEPGEPVAIVGGLYDWTYLIDAHRPPAMSFLPSFATFTKRQLEASVSRVETVDYCFFVLGPDGKPSISNAELSADIMPIIERDFVFDGAGKNLGAWKRLQQRSSIDR